MKRQEPSPLRLAREQEGMSRAALARECGMAEKTLKRAEDGEGVSAVTRHKIVKGFNRLPDRLDSYTHDMLFPSQ